MHHQEPQAGLVGCCFETVMLVEDLEPFKILSLPLVKTNDMNYFKSW